MDHYLQLRNYLLTTLPVNKQNFYYQPPEDQKLSYPCIICSLEDIDTKYANDKPYQNVKKYKITVIDSDPLSVISDNVSFLGLTKFVTAYSTNGLNHFVYNLYY